MSEKINFKYFYKGREIINLEEANELLKSNNIVIKTKTSKEEDVTNVYLEDLVPAIFLLDEMNHFPHQWSNFWKHCPTTVGEVVHTNPFNTGDYCPKKERVKDIEKNWSKLTAPFKGKESEGVKYNGGKPQLSVLFKQFPDALNAIARCSSYGHNKYKEFDADFLNFKRVEGGSKSYADAGLRHRTEEGNDLESGLPHQYHVAWNALAELQLWIEEQKTSK